MTIKFKAAMADGRSVEQAPEAEEMQQRTKKSRVVITETETECRGFDVLNFNGERDCAYTCISAAQHISLSKTVKQVSEQAAIAKSARCLRRARWGVIKATDLGQKEWHDHTSNKTKYVFKSWTSITE